MIGRWIARWKQRHIQKRAKRSLDEELRLLQEEHEDLIKQVERIKRRVNFK